MNKFNTGAALVLLSAFGFGVMPIFALFSYREGVNVISLLLLRFSLSAAFFFLYLKLSGVKIKISGRQLFMLFLLGGIMYSCQASLYFSALKYIPASLVALLLYTNPIFVAILAFVVDKQPIRIAGIVAIVLSISGLTLVLGASYAAVSLLGIMLALSAALIYSIYIIAGNRVIRDLPPIIATAFITLFAASTLSLAGLGTGALDFSFHPDAWLMILGIVVFSTIMAMLCFFRGMELIGPTKTSILSIFEPLVTTGFSVMIFADHLSFTQIIGGLAVLAGAALVIKTGNQ